MLIIINVVVFFAYWLPDFLGYSSGNFESAIEKYGMIPYYIIQRRQLSTIFTSMFLHADMLHLGGNMLFLYIFGDNVEDTFGHGRYLLFYLLSGMAASMAHIMAVFNSVDMQALLIPTIGASGAISGVLGAYLVLYPRARVLTLILIGWLYIVPIPAVVFLGFWFAYQFLYGLLALETALAGIAYWAHIGGFIIGLFFGAIWRGKRRKREF